MNDQDLYLKGMNDLVEAMSSYKKLEWNEIDKIFDGKHYYVEFAVASFGPQDFVNRINNYKKEQAKPKLGDVVEIEYVDEKKEHCIFIHEAIHSYEVLCPDTACPLQVLLKDIVKSITKTGQHMDIRVYKKAV